MQKNRRVNRAQAIILPKLAQSRSRNHLIKLEQVPGKTLCSKRLRASRLHLVSIILNPSKPNLKPQVGESELNNVREWSQKDKKKYQEPVHMPYRLACQRVQKFTCMPRLTQWIRTSRKMCQDPVNMIYRTVQVIEMAGPQLTQWVLDQEPI